MRDVVDDDDGRIRRICGRAVRQLQRLESGGGALGPGKKLWLGWPYCRSITYSRSRSSEQSTATKSW